MRPTPFPDADGMVPCAFCDQPVKATGKDTWHRVLVWVGGPKHAGSCLTSQEVYDYAHALCIRLAKSPAGSRHQGSLL